MAFRFKKFSISDANTAMKIGTDAVLLGSLAEAENCFTMLDVGAGCGIISLMMAQRYENLKIDAIEVDEGAIVDLKNNIYSSIYRERIDVISGDFITYKFDKSYDLIISNPPFFQNNKKSTDNSRKLARQILSLTPEILCERAVKIMSQNSKLIVIFPIEARIELIKSALLNNLYIQKEIIIKDKVTGNPVRTIFTFVNYKTLEIRNEVFVLKENDDSYSKEYKDATKEFYLS